MTVTAHCAESPLRPVVADMTAAPVPTAETNPFSDTVATLSSEDVHVTLSVASGGVTVAERVEVSPTLSVRDVLSSEIPVALISATSTSHSALKKPMVAVMTALPRALPVTTPSETVATDSSEELQTTPAALAAGSADTCRVRVLLRPSTALVLSSDTLLMNPAFFRLIVTSLSTLREE